MSEPRSGVSSGSAHARLGVRWGHLASHHDPREPHPDMSRPLKKIVAAYRRHTLGHTAASFDGDTPGVDRHHRRIVEALLALRDHGADGERALLDLLEDDETAVRGWAATHALEFDESLAIQILEEVANDPRLVGIEAQAVLEEWRARRIDVS